MREAKPRQGFIQCFATAQLNSTRLNSFAHQDEEGGCKSHPCMSPSVHVPIRAESSSDPFPLHPLRSSAADNDRSLGLHYGSIGQGSALWQDEAGQSRMCIPARGCGGHGTAIPALGLIKVRSI
ncbi:hypothetical protein V2G26_008495 [Clonostachys chloroleuca]